MAVLGKGAYGQVKLVLHVSTHSRYALKVVPKQFQTENGIQAIKREILLQRQLDHPHVIKLLDYLEDSDSLYLVLEYAASGSLFRRLRRSPSLSETQIRRYFLQTCLGVQYLHSHDIVHRDIKPENLLLTTDNNIKIGDFGWSSRSNETRGEFCGTLDYMAPEMVAGQEHSFEVDVWGLGVLLYELVHGKPPFQAQNNKEKCRQILSLAYSCAPAVPVLLQDLIQGMLRAVPQDRLSLSDILAHPWMQQTEENDSSAWRTDHSHEFALEELEQLYEAPTQAKSLEVSSEEIEGQDDPPVHLDKQETCSEEVSPLVLSAAETPTYKVRSADLTPVQKPSLSKKGSITLHAAPLSSRPRQQSLDGHSKTAKPRHRVHAHTARDARLKVLLAAAKELPPEKEEPRTGLMNWIGRVLTCGRR